MIELHSGDILKADAEALVNTVNCVGVMGRGIALQFKKAFPANFDSYKTACGAGELKPGRVLVHDLGRMMNPRFIINFPTKNHWRAKSRIEDIRSGLVALKAEVEARGIRSIAIPPLGCGLGGLSWSQVRPCIEEAFGELTDVRVLLFEPGGAPEAKNMARTRAPNMTPGRAALLGLIDRYLGGLMDPFVTLLEFHKAMYLMQEAGEPLRLKYDKGLYGPYLTNLRHVLNALEGHWIFGYGDAEDAPEKPIQIDPAAAKRALEFLKGHDSTLERFERVIDLIRGFETPSGMELLATVHWVAHQEHASTSAEAVEKVHAWSERKRRFDPRQIEIAWNTLQTKGWLVGGSQ